MPEMQKLSEKRMYDMQQRKNQVAYELSTTGTFVKSSGVSLLFVALSVS